MSNQNSVLITCPPMLATKAHYQHLFVERGINLYTPDVIQTLSEDELCGLLPEFNGWIIGDDPASSKVLDVGAKGKLSAAVKWGVGVDNVDFSACKKLGIKVSNTPAMFGKEVADMALGYIIALARETFAIDRSIREGVWRKIRGVSLSQKTIGIVGFGDIGKNLVTRVGACGMAPIVYDPFANEQEIEALGAKLMAWPEGLPDCDFIAFCCALTNENKHMLNEQTLEICKDGIRVINVARGPLIDQRALEEALKNGKAHSAALDVFEEEPLPRSSKLIEHEKCVLGSHNSSNTIEAVYATNLKACEILFDFLGEAPI